MRHVGRGNRSIGRGYVAGVKLTSIRQAIAIAGCAWFFNMVITQIK